MIARIRSGASHARWLLAPFILFALGNPTFGAVALPEGYRRVFEEGAANGAYASIAVGLIQGGDEQAWFFGKAPAADAASAFEIGAVSDVFTGLLLARAVLDGKVRLDEPLANFAPELVAAGAGGFAQTTLAALAIQQSGLPTTPANLFPASADDPYAGYGPADLLAFLATMKGPSSAAAPAFSALNAGLLGAILARVYGSSFDDVLGENVLKPLGLTHTQFEDAPNLLPGHAFGSPVPHWHYAALRGAAGLRSTLGDLLAFVRANLAPDGSRLRAPLLLARQARADTREGALGLGWNIHEVATGEQTWPLVWRASESGGFSAFIGFRTDRQQGLVLLANSATALAPIGLAWLTDAPPPPPPAAPHVPAPAELARYPGLYRLLSGGDALVRSVGGALSVQLRGQPPWPLHALVDGVFTTRDGAFGVTFVRNIDAISGLLLQANGTFVSAERLSERAPRLTRATRALDTRTLAEYSGDYLLDPQTMLRIAIAGGGLAAQYTACAPIAMHAYAPDRFADADGTNGLVFERNEAHRITSVTIDLAGGERKATPLQGRAATAAAAPHAPVAGLSPSL